MIQLKTIEEYREDLFSSIKFVDSIKKINKYSYNEQPLSITNSFIDRWIEMSISIFNRCKLSDDEILNNLSYMDETDISNNINKLIVELTVYFVYIKELYNVTKTEAERKEIDLFINSQKQLILFLSDSILKDECINKLFINDDGNKIEEIAAKDILFFDYTGVQTKNILRKYCDNNNQG